MVVFKLTFLAGRVISRIRSLNRLKSFGAMMRKDLGAVAKAEAQELSLLRLRHRALRLVDLEPELLGDEVSNGTQR